MEKQLTTNRLRPNIITLIAAFAILLAINITFTSCNDDEDPIYYQYGTVDKKGSSEFDILLDNGQTLKIVESGIHAAQLRDSMRLLNYYEIKEDMGSTLLVRLLDADTILTKPILNYDANKLDSIGKDPIRITACWYANGFINMQFIYRGAYTRPIQKHMINLLKKEDKKGNLSFEFRHNAFNDIEETMHKGHVSFKIGSLFSEITTPTDFFIKFNTSSSSQDSVKFEYRK